MIDVNFFFRIFCYCVFLYFLFMILVSIFCYIESLIKKIIRAKYFKKYKNILGKIENFISFSELNVVNYQKLQSISTQNLTHTIIISSLKFSSDVYLVLEPISQRYYFINGKNHKLEAKSLLIEFNLKEQYVLDLMMQINEITKDINSKIMYKYDICYY